jgi:putative spermidine/putrescine transport system substrate-binding protein
VQVITQRCLTGLIFSSVAAAILHISLATAQTGQQSLPDSIQQESPAPQAEAAPEPVDAIAEQSSPAPQHDPDLAAEKPSGASPESSAYENDGPAPLAGTAEPQQASPDAAAGIEPHVAVPTANAASTEANAAFEPTVATQPHAPADPVLDPKKVTLNIATWGGAYGQSQKLAFFRPFADRHGYRIETAIYDGSYEELMQQGDKPLWSLVDLNGEAMIRACDEGRLERLDFTILEASPDGAPLSEDFLPGAIHPCGIASVAWSAVIVYDKELGTPPAALEDFFNTGKIPGKRLLPKQPRYSLELALMADGVPPDQVYAILKTQEGQDRAFRKLSSIKDDILWWETPSEVFGLLAKGKAIMGLAFNGRAFMAMFGARQPIEILWDRQIYSFDYWSMPRGAPFPQAAKDFIRFATSSGPLSDQARWIPYGPARRSALKLVGKHVELGVYMKQFLPTYGPNFASALAFDGAFWAMHDDSLRQRFADWAEGRQLPPQKAAAISR